MIAVWTGVLTDRGLVVTLDYQVNDPDIEFYKVTKKVTFTFNMRNEGKGHVVLKNLYVAESVLSPSIDYDSLTEREKPDQFDKYFKCTGYKMGVGPKDWIPGKDRAVIESGQTISISADLHIIENTGLPNDEKWPGQPICLVASLLDQFGNVEIAQTIGAIKTGAGIRYKVEDRDVEILSSTKIDLLKFFYMINKSKCFYLFSTPICLRA